MKNLLLLLLAVLLSGCAGAMDKGAVCFTFDDYAGANWLKADKIFKKYNAHVTFFVVGNLTAQKLEVMKKLQAAGHSVGLHSIHHRNAVPLPEGWTAQDYFNKEVKPQLDICRKAGLNIQGFAYPNNRRNETIDRELFKHFNFLRAGKGKTKALFYGAKDVKEKMVLGGGGIGTYYKSNAGELKKILAEAAEKKALVVFFSHNIYPGAKGVHMPEELLEELLSAARALDMKIIGINEIASLK